MRRWATVLAALATLAVLGECGTASPGGTGDPPQTPPADPVELVGLWRVQAPSEVEDTWLRLDAGELVLFRGDGMVSGSWVADGRTLLTHTYAFSGTEPDGVVDREAAWLLGAHGYRPADDDGWQIVDDDGEPLATLTVDGAPEPIASAADWYTEPPEVTEQTRAAFAEPAPVPDGLEPVTADDLPGRWVPAGETFATDPHVVFDAAGHWQGSDGCNGVGGRWAPGDDGRLLTIGGPMTLIGCEGAPVGSWVESAARAGLDGEDLVLVDRDGAEVGRLVRD